jgi:hypothetical protein
MDKETVSETLEEAVFKTLNHQKRRDILRFIGEKKTTTFTGIKNAVNIEDSPSLSYHLNALNGLIIQEEGKYVLTELGQDAFNLICKATAFSTSNSLVRKLRKELPVVIIANAILWAAAIFVVYQFQGTLHEITLLSFAALWFISNIILYSISMRIKKPVGCRI